MISIKLALNSLPGKFPPSIIVGVIVSVFSLAWGSSRAFFIERTRDEADPDPALNMVVLWVFPCMLLIAVNSMTMWTLTGGILGKAYKLMFLILFLGPWVFLAMIFLFIVNVIVLTLVAREFCQKVTEETPNEKREKEEKKTSELPAVELTTEEELATKKTGQEETQESQTTGTEVVTEEEMISTGASSPQEAKVLTEKPKMESKPFYELKAAITAMWLPAVVGDKKNLFIAASVSTLITKILMLLVSVILAYFFQEEMHPHPFILWSRVGKTSDC